MREVEFRECLLLLLQFPPWAPLLSHVVEGVVDEEEEKDDLAGGVELDRGCCCFCCRFGSSSSSFCDADKVCHLRLTGIAVNIWLPFGAVRICN